MKLPLFVFAPQQENLTSPMVLVGKGNWILEKNDNSCFVTLHKEDGSPFPLTQEGKVEILEQQTVYAVIKQKGIEKSLTLFLSSDANPKPDD